MKDDLIGRVVGFNRVYREDGATRVVWARVTGEHRNDANYLIAKNIHTGVSGLVFRAAIHTTMPKAY